MCIPVKEEILQDILAVVLNRMHIWDIGFRALWKIPKLRKMFISELNWDQLEECRKCKLSGLVSQLSGNYSRLKI